MPKYLTTVQTALQEVEQRGIDKSRPNIVMYAATSGLQTWLEACGRGEPTDQELKQMWGLIKETL